jgi:putative transposase
MESFVTKARDKVAALKFIKKAMKRHGRTRAITTDGLRSYSAALKEIGAPTCRRWDGGKTIGPRIPTSPSDDENGRC